MKESLLDILRCPACKKKAFQLTKKIEDYLEVREGSIVCKNCSTSYEIKEGILDFLKDPTDFVSREIKAMDEEEYLRDQFGNAYRINNETIEKFRDKFLSLPEGDGSHFFKKGGCFYSIRNGSERFYKTLDIISLKGGESVLELGSGFSWASRKFAERGCKVVALDISSYLKASQVYLEEVYFERVFSDMHNLPFVDNSFDIVFGSAVLHHTKNLKDVFSEIYRVLKDTGRLVLINESARGIFEKRHPDLRRLEERGFQDTSYTIPQWIKGIRQGGFKEFQVQFLSLLDDYITRHKDDDIDLSIKISNFIKRHTALEDILLAFLKYPRIFFRPKSWRVICYKG